MRNEIWLSLIAFASPAFGQSTTPRELFSPPGDMWLLPGSGFSTTDKYYGPTSPSANWVVSQWNTPEDLPPFQNGDTHNASLHVHLEPDHTYTLEQSGQALSCNRTYQTGLNDVHEFDLFIGPNNANRPEYPVATQNVSSNFSDIRHLYHKITVLPLFAQVMDTECPITRTVFLTSVTLTDPSKTQTLFYQLRLGIVQVRNGEIETTLPPPFWFAKGHDARGGRVGYYGYDDSITSYDEPGATVGSVSAYSIDLLPHLVSIIRDGADYGMDQDLSHWSVRGTYHGEVIWGHIHVRSHWSGFSLAVQ